MRAEDNPKDDSRFDNYKLWSDPAPTKMTIYAHRRPIAQFSVGFTGLDSSGNYLTSVSDNSYDPDHTSRTDKGIAARQWKWKNINDSAWTSGALPSALAPGQTYLAELTVQDIDGPGGLGAWSYPAVETIATTGGNFPPTVDCSPQSQPWTNSNISVNVTATDSTPDLSYINYEWSTSTSKPASGWTRQTATNNASYSFSTSQSSEGAWYLHMEAFDAAGNSFYRVRGPYDIDKTPPGGTYSPNSQPSPVQSIAVTFTPTDNLSGVKQWRYRVSVDGGSTYGAWSSYIATGSGTVNLNTLGTNVIQSEVTDNAGNIATVTTGTYDIQSLSITNVSLSGYWNHWRGQTETWGDPNPNVTYPHIMSVEPHRFLSLECVKIDITTQGDPDSVVVRFSPGA